MATPKLMPNQIKRKTMPPINVSMLLAAREHTDQKHSAQYYANTLPSIGSLNNEPKIGKESKGSQRPHGTK